MKIYFKMNEMLDFNLHWIFNLYEHVLATSLEKRKTNFPHLYSWSSLCFHYAMNNILLHHQNFLSRNPEISVRWFLLESVLKQMWVQGWQGKRKEVGTMLLRYQLSVTSYPRTALRTFSFTEIVKEWKWKWVFSQWTHIHCS